MNLLKAWVIPTLIIFLLAGVVIAVAIPLVNGMSDDDDTFEERRGERGSFDGERDGERGERGGERGGHRGFSFVGLVGGIVKQGIFMLVGGGITLLILTVIRQFNRGKTPPTQPEAT
jgi:hypothetical protein